MPACVIVQVKIKDAEKLSAYSRSAGPTVAAHGGQFTMRAAAVEDLTGRSSFERLVVIEFPDVETARAWYSSAEYRELIPLRDEGADMTFTLVQTA